MVVKMSFLPCLVSGLSLCGTYRGPGTTICTLVSASMKELDRSKFSDLCLAGTHKPVEFPLELSVMSVCSFRSAEQNKHACVFLTRERQNVNINIQEEHVVNN